MGLFGPSKTEKENAEKKVKDALSKATIMNDIMFTLRENVQNAPWILNCTGYYDSRYRTILVGSDLLSVVNGTILFENGEPKQPKCEYLNFSYTASGYKPLHSYNDSKGDAILDVNQVIGL